jgi:hypothetical protein
LWRPHLVLCDRHRGADFLNDVVQVSDARFKVFDYIALDYLAVKQPLDIISRRICGNLHVGRFVTGKGECNVPSDFRLCGKSHL